MEEAKQSTDNPKPKLTGHTCQKSCSLPAGVDLASGIALMMQEMQQSAEAMCTMHMEQKDDIIKGLNGEIEKLRKCLLQSEARETSLTEEKRKQIAEKCALKEDLDNLKNEMQDVQVALSKQKRANEELRDQVEGLSNLKKENDILSKRMSYLTSRHDTTVQQLREKNEEVETVTGVNEALLKSLSVEVQKSDKAEWRAEKAESEIQALEVALREHKRMNDEERESAMQEKQALTDKLTEQRRKIDELDAQVKEYNGSIVTLVGEKKVLNDLMAALQSSLVESQQKISDLEEELMQKHEQFRGVSRFTMGLDELMRELKPLDIVKAASGEGGSGIKRNDQVNLEPIESDHLSSLTNSGKEFRELPQLPANVPDVTMDILVFFAPQMGGKWDSIAYALKVGHMSSLLASSQQPTDSKCLTVLQTWIEQGPEVTWQNLVEALWKLGLRSTAVDICEKLIELAIEK